MAAHSHIWPQTERLMISFFRRALSSWIVLGLLGLILVAFIITGVNTPGSLGGAAGDGGAIIAKAGDTRIRANELVRQAQNQLEAARREQPGLDQKAFLAGGGFEGVTDALISSRAIESWGRAQGFAIGKRLIDAQIAGMPAFRGVTGQFDEAVMRNALAQARISEKNMRADIAGDLMRGQILTPVAAAPPAPATIAKPYATLLLERRTGIVGIIPLSALTDPSKPSEAAIAAAYKAGIAVYTRPEARVLRYALFGAAQVASQAVPTEAEIAVYYRDNAARYAASESRNLSQVIAPSEAVARGIATASKAGTPLAAAATKSGLEASRLTNQKRADYAGASSEAIAAASFSAPKGSITGPLKGPFGWYVVQVDAVANTPARALDQARPEIVAVLTAQKSHDALSDLAGKIEDAIADGASFAEVAANHKLTVVETPAILANGQPVQPGWTAPPELPALLRTGFEAAIEDRPTVETIAKDQQFALLSVAKVIPPTPLPLAQVRDTVARDIIVKRAAERAKAIGAQVTAAVNKGVPLVKALSDTGVKLPPPQAAGATQLDLARIRQSGAEVPPPVLALFSLEKGKAKLSADEKRGVLFVTVLDAVIPGNLAAMPGLLDNTRQDLARSYASELGEQFVRSVEQDVKVTRYPQAIAATKRLFAGGQ